jgi:hypothetical protein
VEYIWVYKMPEEKEKSSTVDGIEDSNSRVVQ